ncbi:MAG: radical SAM protein [Bacilli bacterium]
MGKLLIERKDINGKVHKIIKSSIVDGPGNRIAIFMQGCNFNCWYCHNPETIRDNVSFTNYTAKELYLKLEKYFVFVDGITLSGGEVLLQQEFVYEFCKLIKSNTKLSCFIDTNASIEIDDKLFDVIDYFMVDVKVIDENEHFDLTKNDNKTVIANLRKINKLKKLYEVRTVLYPGYNHEETIAFVNTIIDKDVTYKKIKFHSNGVRKEFKKRWEV